MNGIFLMMTRLCYYYNFCIVIIIAFVISSRVNGFCLTQPLLSSSSSSSFFHCNTAAFHHRSINQNKQQQQQRVLIHYYQPSRSSSSSSTLLIAVTVDTLPSIHKMESESSARINSLVQDNSMVTMMEPTPAQQQQQQQQQHVETKAEAEIEEVVPTSMGQAWRIFLLGSYNGPRLVCIMIAVMAYWRVVVLPDTLGVMDGIVAMITIFFWCIQEHVLHGKLLHSKNLDWYGKQIHEEHHAKPYHHVSLDPAWLMMTWLAVAHVLLRYIIFPSSLSYALTATVAYAMAGLWYEFLHYIVHTKVRFSKGSYLRRMKDHHARHHLVDSRYWLGFSLPVVDDWFDTNPTMSQVRQWHKLEKKIGQAQEVPHG